MVDEVLEYRLRDGAPVRISRISRADRERLRTGLQGLSAASRYRRFMTATDRLTEAQLRYLTEPDQQNHLAWGAVDPTQPGEPGLGVARCIRLPDEPTVAEAAVAVIDACHGRGLGTLLLGVLARDALAHGIRTFRGYVLTDNRPALTLFEDLGAVTRSVDGAVLTFDLPLDPDGLPDTPAGRIFKAVADERLPAPLNPFAPDPPAPASS